MSYLFTIISYSEKTYTINGTRTVYIFNESLHVSVLLNKSLLFQIIKPTLFHNHLLSMLTMEELPGKGPHLHEFGSCLFCFFVESGSFLLFGHFLTSNVWRSSWNDSTLSPSPPLWDEMCKNAHKNNYYTVSIPIPDIRNPDSSEDQIYSNGDSIWKL